MKRFLQALCNGRIQAAQVIAILIVGTTVARADVSIPLRIPVPESTTTGLPGQACAPASPADITGQVQEALCEGRQASLNSVSGHVADAETHYLKSFSLWDKLGEEYRPAAVTALMNVGCFYRETNRLADAEQTLLKALRMQQDLPSGSGVRTAMIQSRLGDVYSETSDPEKGRALLTGALLELEKEKAANKREIAYAYSTLGMVDMRRGTYQAAEDHLRKALALDDDPDEDRAVIAGYQGNLALVLFMERRYSGAELLLKRVVFTLEQTPGKHRLQLATALAAMGLVQMSTNELSAAERTSLKVLSILDELQVPDNPDKVLARVNLGAIYLRERKLDEAGKTLPADVAWERQHVADKRVLGDGLRLLAELRALQKRWYEAAGLYVEALGMYEAALGPTHRDLAPVLREYAEVLKRSGGHKGELKGIETRARSLENAALPA